MIIRFWISVDSLNRPPTLLTIPSSLSSSCIALSPKVLLQQRPDAGDRGVEVVVDEAVVVLAGALDLADGLGQAPLDGRLVLRPAPPQPLLQHRHRRRQEEDRDG